jgi:ribose 5-phosphate isomerase B
MKLSFGSDMDMHVARVTVERLQQAGHEVVVYGPVVGQAMLWPDVARRVAEDVAQTRAEEGILFCWTGTGVSIAANKVPNVRAALCDDAETARGARLWNDANVLCMSLRRTSEVVAEEILDRWFETSYKPNPEDDTCLAQIEALEGVYRQPAGEKSLGTPITTAEG